MTHQPPSTDLLELPDVAISLRQPWAWLVIHGPKDIENRSFRWKNGLGRFLVHASKGMTYVEYREAWVFAHALGVQLPAFEAPEIERGGIIGVVTNEGPIIGPEPSGIPWHITGRYGYPLTERRPLPFVACLGARGRWKVPANVLAELRQKLAA